MGESRTGNYKCISENGALGSSGESLVAEKSMDVEMLSKFVTEIFSITKWLHVKVAFFKTHFMVGFATYIRKSKWYT